MKPRVSIVVPVHNAADCMDRAIESCLSQKRVAVELILVVNGSSDRSQEIAEEYAKEDERVKVIVMGEKGVSMARNRGMEAADGDYIGFVDADDYIENDMYSVLCEAIGQETDVVSICEYYIGGNGGKRGVTDELFSIGDRKDSIRKAMLGALYENEPQIMGSVWRFLIPMDVIRVNKIRFDEQLSIGEDMFFLLEILDRIERVRIVNKPLYHYVKSDCSVSNQFGNETWKEYMPFFERILSLPLGEDEKKRIENKVIALSSWLLQETLQTKKKYEIKKREFKERLGQMETVLQKDRLAEDSFYYDAMNDKFLHTYIRYGLWNIGKRQIKNFCAWMHKKGD